MQTFIAGILQSKNAIDNEEVGGGGQPRESQLV